MSLIRLLPGTAFLTILFALAMIFVRLQPYHEPLEAEFGACAVPCWQGIEPGTTTREDVLARAVGDVTSPLCYSRTAVPCEMFQWASPDVPRMTTGVQIQRGRVASISIKSPGVTLAGILLTLDQLDRSLYDVQVGYSVDRMYLWLTFSNASIGVSTRTECPAGYLALMRSPVDMIVIQSSGSRAPHPSSQLAELRRLFYHLCEH